MSYSAGVDLGTTFTSAATARARRSDVISLGASSPAMPSVVLLGADGRALVGEVAVQRGLTEPSRVAREFKRRLGDPTPLLLGGSPYAPQACMSRMLEHALEVVTEREGAPPDRVVVTHPANWGGYKREYLEQVVQLAGVRTATTITEPEAAAVWYAIERQPAVGETVAVYDLGGGTFDAAILRRTAEGFDIVGTPQGIEHLGGVDFDAALLAHVDDQLDGVLATLDHEDAHTAAAVQQLRAACVDAKIALSVDTTAIVPVVLPGRVDQVRVTRTEFEELIRPPLLETIEALRRTLASADLEAGDLGAVLLVGGSSRIPLVGALVHELLGRPVAVDADPKLVVCRGAALWAEGVLQPTPAPAPPTLDPEPELAAAAPPPPPEPDPQAPAPPPPPEPAATPPPPPEPEPAPEAPESSLPPPPPPPGRQRQSPGGTGADSTAVGEGPVAIGRVRMPDGIGNALEGVVCGHDPAAIADALGIADETAVAWIRRAFDSLGIDDSDLRLQVFCRYMRGTLRDQDLVAAHQAGVRDIERARHHLESTLAIEHLHDATGWRSDRHGFAELPPSRCGWNAGVVGVLGEQPDLGSFGDVFDSFFDGGDFGQDR